MKRLKSISVLLSLLALPLLIVAQPLELTKAEKKQMALQHAENLYDGVLIVQLKTFRNKINALRKMKPTKRNKKYLKALLKERKELGLATIAAYKANYTFSKVYFMPDTLTSKLLEGTKKGIFLNDSLEIDNTIDLGKMQHYLAYVGTPPIASSSGKISLLIVGSDNKLVKSPFPYATRFYSFFQTLARTTEAEAMPKAVARLEKRLRKFSRKE